MNTCAGKFDLFGNCIGCWTEMPNQGGVTARNILVSPRLILFRWKPGFDLVTRFQPLRFSFKPAAKYRAGLSVDSLLFGNFFFFFFLRKVDGYWIQNRFYGVILPCFFQYDSVSLYFFKIFKYRCLYLNKMISIVDIRVLFFNFYKNSSSIIMIL